MSFSNSQEKVMKIGYLHIGSPEHGVCRYGRLLAAEARKHPDLEVIEVSVTLTNDRTLNRDLLIQAARQLSETDVIHFQFNKFNKSSWGGGRLQLEHLRIFMHHCLCPLVVTLHDVFYNPPRLKQILKSIPLKVQFTPSQGQPSLANQSLDSGLTEENRSEDIGSRSQQSSKRQHSMFRRVSKVVQNLFEDIFGADAIALREIGKQASLIFVCTEAEASRLSDRIDQRKLKVIPHFVEERSITISSTEARKKLALENVNVLTLLGFIYPPKGHRILVEALPHLPWNVKVVFAGGASSSAYEAFVTELLDLAKRERVEDRLRITGYLTEAELELYLMATDLAICPFSRFSASGSLSTWISVARPILASDLPQIHEYNQLEADAIQTFQPYTSTALADKIQQLLLTEQWSDNEAKIRLRQKLSISNIVAEHRTCYQQIVAKQPFYLSKKVEVVS